MEISLVDMLGLDSGMIMTCAKSLLAFFRSVFLQRLPAIDSKRASRWTTRLHLALVFATLQGQIGMFSMCRANYEMLTLDSLAWPNTVRNKLQQSSRHA